ncbi:(d)CMP kinase [Bacteroidota bacterium]
MMDITIAIDGYSSCGKSTLAKDLAKYYNFAYIDSGAMYRCVTLYCIENNFLHGNIIDREKLKEHISKIKISFKYNSEKKSNITFLNDKDVEEKIRSIEVSNHVSPISEIDFVREKMVRIQKEMGIQKNVVMDGRDIGTVVFPDADIKIFMVANEEIRILRRYKELKNKDNPPDLEVIRENIKKRDYIDTHRKISPLTKADDAIILDNSNQTPQEQFDWAIDLINNKYNS